MSETTPDAAISAAISGERTLLDPVVRSIPDAVGELLADDFSEIERSGRFWNRESLLAELDEFTASHPTMTGEMMGRMVGPGLVLLTYQSGGADDRALRSSLWRLERAGWKLVHHQATPAPVGGQESGASAED